MTLRRWQALVAIALVVVGCASQTSSPTPSGTGETSATTSPSSSPSVGSRRAHRRRPPRARSPGSIGVGPTTSNGPRSPSRSHRGRRRQARPDLARPVIRATSLVSRSSMTWRSRRRSSSRSATPTQAGRRRPGARPTLGIGTSSRWAPRRRRSPSPSRSVRRTSSSQSADPIGSRSPGPLPMGTTGRCTACRSRTRRRPSEPGRSCHSGRASSPAGRSDRSSGRATPGSGDRMTARPGGRSPTTRPLTEPRSGRSWIPRTGSWPWRQWALASDRPARSRSSRETGRPGPGSTTGPWPMACRLPPSSVRVS